MAIRNLDSLIPGSSLHLSETNFRKFEPDIRLICNNFPGPTTIKPIGYTPPSYVNRLRSIMGAYIKSDWKSDIPRDIVLAIRTLRKITYDLNTGLVYIGRGAFQEHLNSSPISTSVENDKTIDSNNSEILRAVCLLKHHNILNGVVKLHSMTMQLALDLMEEFPNCAIEMREDGSAVVV